MAVRSPPDGARRIGRGLKSFAIRHRCRRIGARVRARLAMGGSDHVLDPMQKAVRNALIAFMAAMAEAQAEATREAQRAGIAHAMATEPRSYRGRKPSFDRAQLDIIRNISVRMTARPPSPRLQMCRGRSCTGSRMIPRRLRLFCWSGIFKCPLDWRLDVHVPFGLETGRSRATPEARSPPEAGLDRGTSRASRRVESGCGAVVLGPACLFPPLSSGGALVARP